MKIPFSDIKESLWKVLKAAETSLSVSEVARKASVDVSTASRLLSEIEKGERKVAIRFEIDMKKVGIVNVAVITRKHFETLPFLQSYRVLKLLGRKLHLYVAMLPRWDATEEWVSNFDESAIIVRAVEQRFWSVSSPATTYEEGYVCGDISQLTIDERSPPTLSHDAEVKLDEIDVLAYWGKARWPFTSFREMAQMCERYIGRSVSHQVLSWHFRKHLLKLWIGNRVRLYADVDRTPYRILYLEGRDAPAVARALVKLPWFHTAYIDFSRALVSGQPPCESFLPLYRQLGELDIETLDFAVEPSTAKWVPIFNLLLSIVKEQRQEEVMAR